MRITSAGYVWINGGISGFTGITFRNLFKGAGELTDNKAAMNSLVQAVKEIRDALAGSATTAAPAATTGGTTTPAATGSQAGLTPVLNNINAALGRLNATMSTLPSEIQSIKFKVPGS
jgi:hypothetical protein